MDAWRYEVHARHETGPRDGIAVFLIRRATQRDVKQGGPRERVISQYAKLYLQDGGFEWAEVREDLRIEPLVTIAGITVHQLPEDEAGELMQVLKSYMRPEPECF